MNVNFTVTSPPKEIKEEAIIILCKFKLSLLLIFPDLVVNKLLSLFNTNVFFKEPLVSSVKPCGFCYTSNFYFLKKYA